MADARLVANRFVELARADNRGLSPMALIKLVYIAHGWTLGLTGQPLIAQPVEAWQYGPVIRDVYNGVRNHGRAPVIAPIWAPAGELTGAEVNLIDQVYKLYGNYDGIALSNITHMPDTPWAQTYRPGEFGVRIPNELIAEHYKRLAAERAGGRQQ